MIKLLDIFRKKNRNPDALELSNLINKSIEELLLVNHILYMLYHQSKGRQKKELRADLNLVTRVINNRI